jgi:hypothetical protein
MNTIKLLFRWLESRHESIKKVSEQDDFDSDYMRGFNAGMKKAAEMYDEEIQSIRKALDGYMVEDVDLSGMEDEAHVS